MTLFGIGVGTQTAGGVGVVYDRNCGAGSPIECHEEQVQLDTGNPTFRFGANRGGGHYGFMSNNFANLITGVATDPLLINDKLYDRLPLISHKYDNTGTLWTAVGAASPSVNVAIYNRIVLFGQQIKAWQDVNAGVGKWGCTFQWSFHHEPNNESGQGGTLALQSAGWRSAFVNILDIWRTVSGVRFWEGGSNLSTTTEGIIPIICLVSGISSGHANDIQSYWGNNADMNRVCRGYFGDPYNIGTHFRPFSNINSDLKAWSDAKQISQTALGYTFMQGVWETGTRDTNGYVDADSSWLPSYGAPNKANWYAQASNYLKTSYRDCAIWTYYDDAPANSNQPDQTQASWDSWLLNFCTSDFEIATSPIPGTGPPIFDDTVVTFDDLSVTFDGAAAPPAPAFQSDAFQPNAFAIGTSSSPVFQSDAFQLDAFQTSLTLQVDITQTAPSFTQALTGVTARVLTIDQTAPAFEQTLDIHAVEGLNISQTAPAFEQAATVDMTVVVAIERQVQTFQVDSFDPDAFQSDADAPITAPAFTQHLSVGVHTAGTVITGISQTAPGFEQAADISSTVRILTVDETAPAFTQSATLFQPPAISITQTAPAFTQEMRVDLEVNATGEIHQTAPGFTQSMVIQIISWGEWEVGAGDEWLVGTGDEWLVRQ